MELEATVLRGYEIEKQIGEGGFALVYRARQVSVKREVAIKIISPALASIPSFITSFENEARLIAQIEHPHIVPLYDFWRDPSGAYLIMRLMSGGNLRDYIENKQLDGSEVLRIFDQISAALVYAHQHKVIHKDIKPENILLDSNHNFYLADFGIAQELDAVRDESEDTELQNFFPLEYASPEQIALRELSVQSDIFNLGMVLWELVSHKRPKDMFGGGSMSQFINQRVTEKVPSLALELPLAFLDDVIQVALALNPDERFKTVQEFRRAIKEAVTYRSGQMPYMLDAEFAQDIANIPNPYKGLQAFDEEDRENFFGREQLETHLLNRLKQKVPYERFLAVVGASGSGKSSLVKAGLFPKLRSGFLDSEKQFFITSMIPSSHPYENLASALLKVSPLDCDILALLKHGMSLKELLATILPDERYELILLIDQFEEIFTLIEDEALRSKFLNLLYEAVVAENNRIRIIITLRADFYDRPLYYEGFSRLMQSRTETVTAFSEQEIREVIISPLKNTGVLIEPELVSQILIDVKNQVGMLPLLQYALLDLFESRTGQWISKQHYLKNGGILGILSTRANDIFYQLDANSQNLAKQILLRLVTLGEGSRDTRRRAELSELQSLNHDSEQVLRLVQKFERTRILTLDFDPHSHQATVEVAHEAFIHDWKLLSQWLRDYRADVYLQRQVANLSKNWINSKKDWSFLVTGSQLGKFQNLDASHTIQLSQDERAFITASSGLHRARQHLRNAFITFLFLITCVMAAQAAYAIQQQQEAIVAKNSAESRALAMLSMTEPLDTGLLLSLQALATSNTYEAQNSLLTLLLTEPNLDRFWQGNDDFIRTLALDSSGTQLAIGDKSGGLITWDLETESIIFTEIQAHTKAINSIAFSPDGQIIATAGDDGFIHLWDSTDGTLLASLGDGTTSIWTLVFSQEPYSLYSAGQAGSISIWDVQAKELRDLIPNAHSGIIFSLALNPEDNLLASAGEDRLIRLWTIEGNTIQPTNTALHGHQNWIMSLAFSPSGHYLASGSADTKVLIWDTGTMELSQTLIGHQGWVRSLAFGETDSILFSAASDSYILAWNTNTGRAIGRINRRTDSPLWDIAFKNKQLFSVGENSQVAQWNIEGTNRFSSLRFESADDIRRLWWSQDRLYWLGGLALGQSFTNFYSASLLDVQSHLYSQGTLPELVPENFDYFISTLTTNHSGEILVLGGSDGRLLLRDSSNASEREINLSEGIYSLAFSHDEALLALGLNDGRIQLWSSFGTIDEWSLITVLEGQHHDRITDLAFNADDSLLASSSLDGNVVLWRIEDQNPIGMVFAHPDGALTVAFHPLHNLVISSGVDENLMLFDLTDFEHPRRLKTNHTSWILDLEFDPTGTRFATAAADGRIILWDSNLMREVGLPLVGHQDWVTDLQFDSSGAWLFSTGNDGKILEWNMNLSQWQSLACHIAGRNLTLQESYQFLRMERAIYLCP